MTYKQVYRIGLNKLQSQKNGSIRPVVSIERRLVG